MSYRIVAQRDPEVEIISLDRCGSFARGAREGAQQARQVADLPYPAENLRETIRTQLSRAVGSSLRPLLRATDVDDERDSMISCSPGTSMQALSIATLPEPRTGVQGRRSLIESRRCMAKEKPSPILRQTGFDRRTIAKWIRVGALPQRNASAPKTSSPRYFEDYLSRRWAKGCLRGRHLFFDIKARGYTGSFSNLERLLAKWRNPKRMARPVPWAPKAHHVAPATGRLISPIVAAALCIKPRGLLINNQAAKVDALKSEWPEFAAMRRFAMRFRGILWSKDAAKLRVWLNDAHQSGLYAMQRFARTLRRDIDAVRNAVREQWPNGRAEQTD
jgi:transposase